jgi:hypothetical protein
MQDFFPKIQESPLRRDIIHRRIDLVMKRLIIIANENITSIARVDAPNVEKLYSSVKGIITCLRIFGKTNPVFH